MLFAFVFFILFLLLFLRFSRNFCSSVNGAASQTNGFCAKITTQATVARIGTQSCCGSDALYLFKISITNIWNRKTGIVRVPNVDSSGTFFSGIRINSAPVSVLPIITTIHESIQFYLLLYMLWCSLGAKYRREAVCPEILFSCTSVCGYCCIDFLCVPLFRKTINSVFYRKHLTKNYRPKLRHTQ